MDTRWAIGILMVLCVLGLIVTLTACSYVVIAGPNCTVEKEAGGIGTFWGGASYNVRCIELKETENGIRN